MTNSTIYLPLSGGSRSERLLRNRGRLRHAVASRHVNQLKRTWEAFQRGEWRPVDGRKVCDYRISLTSWHPRLPELPLVLLTLLNQTLRPKEVVVWLTAQDEVALAGPVKELFGAFGVRFAVCDDLKQHKKWLPMIEEGQREPFVICDDDIIYPREWFAALVAEDCSDVYVGGKCHSITFNSDKAVNSYSAWDKQIRTDGQPSHLTFITGCGGGIIHPQRISLRFLDRSEMFKQCPRSDDLWLKAAHLAQGIPCYKTHYSFPCLELPGADESGLAVSNVDQGGNDRQIQNLEQYFSLIPR